MEEKDVQENVVEETVPEEVEASESAADAETTELDALKQEMEQLQEDNATLQDKLVRTQADFDNFRKRMKKEKEQDLKYKSQSVMTELLPVLDNFERALQTEQSDNSQGFVEGVEMVYRQLKQALEKEGLEEIATVGEQFDPHLHQAVMQASEADKDDNEVVEELQKGYKLKDRVIRPAMVKVNQS
ncbi:nucleotide exchange factor GrpE [Salirhabdus salicampi]|uniref:nucleotide exchange factor GrpE n=1 Tax=Salirhabdus salicampi TaxID=476102 RepID=UPI0020C3D3ED|nr:nucleotide exchange factor GrpE [Salirhabdus salicampi]MCP8616915.1 nucleotide exchange factor GrpE [Salirhabdus salicampi]